LKHLLTVLTDINGDQKCESKLRKVLLHTLMIFRLPEHQQNSYWKGWGVSLSDICFDFEPWWAITLLDNSAVTLVSQNPLL
jgi:hypothetical protein